MAYIDCIRLCNNAQLSNYMAWRIEGSIYGWIQPAFAAQLLKYPEVFKEQSNEIHFQASLNTAEQRTIATDQVIRELHAQGVIDTWVNERYPVTLGFQQPAVLIVERAAAAYLGIKSFGIHVNGLVKKADGLYVWVGTRTLRKPFWPGKLDQMVAGGLPVGLGLMENLIKEAQEEANIPPSLAQKAEPVSQIQYRQALSRGLEDSTLFVYDLYLPDSFIPENTDGEVEKFQLMPLAELADLTAQVSAFKDNCNLVNLDLLLRHRFIPTTDPDYAVLKQALSAMISI
jgi:8-oxo-dGTP pyrophosphatase MutT (NUDIX family)